MSRRVSPVIFVHFNRGVKSDRLHIVEGLYPSGCIKQPSYQQGRYSKIKLLYLDRQGWHRTIPLQDILHFTQEECKFFRGPTAELMSLMLLWPEAIYRSTHNYELQIQRMQEVEDVIPDMLWSGSRQGVNR